MEVKGDSVGSENEFRSAAEGAARLTVLAGLETVPARGTLVAGWSPAKRSSWCPERKRIWIQRKM